MRTLADIPLEVRFDSAMDSADIYRAAAGQRHGRMFAHRRDLLLSKARHMEAIATNFLSLATTGSPIANPAPFMPWDEIISGKGYIKIDALGTGQSHFDVDAYMKQPSVVASREDFEERIEGEQQRLEDAIETALDYKRRRRQKDSFEKKMRELGYEPVAPQGGKLLYTVEKFQAPENWRYVAGEESK